MCCAVEAQTERGFGGALTTIGRYGVAYSSIDGIDRRVRSVDIANNRDENFRGLPMQTWRAAQGMEAAMVCFGLHQTPTQVGIKPLY